MDFSMLGPGIILGLGCIGSSIGCCIAGMALHGVMTHIEEGHGKFIGLSVYPSSQAIYAFILMIMMKNSLAKGSLSPISGVGIGLFIGAALLISSIYHGKACATAMQAAAKQPAIFGKAFIAPSMIEAFSLFAFVFTLLII